MRVLHLIDAAGPQACATTLALLADQWQRLGAIEQQLLIMGPSLLKRTAQSVGIRGAVTVGVPQGRAILGVASVLPKVRALGRFDAVHCWSVGALTLASLVLTRAGLPRLLTLTTLPDAKTLRWLRALVGEPGLSRVTLLPISATLRHDLIAAGLPENIVHVLRPGLDFSRVATSRRASLRERWNLPSDQTKVVALLSDPPAAADALTSFWPVGLTAQSLSDGYDRLRFLVHPQQHHLLRARRIMREADRERFFLADDELAEPWRVLPGADMALANGPHSGGLSLLWAMASNVPIIGDASYAVSEIVEDRHSALLAKPGDARLLAQRVRILLDDAQLAWKLRDTARHEAFSYFSRQRYCTSMAAIYQQLISHQPIDVPPLPVTGGLRFAGRA